MEINGIAKELSEIERTCILVLKDGKKRQIYELAAETKLPLDSVRRVAQWLNEKELILITKEENVALGLTQAGRSSLSKGLPEKMFIEAIVKNGGKAELNQLKKESMLNEPEFNVAMGIAKRNAWISIRKETEKVVLELTGLEKPLLEGDYKTEKALKVLKAVKEKNFDYKEIAEEREELLRRGLAEELRYTIPWLQINEKGKGIAEIIPSIGKRSFDVRGTAPRIIVGKRHPYLKFLKKIRSRLVELGFKQMESPLITQEFYNFDVLYQPQNHPARAWTDTYQLKKPSKGLLPDRKIVDAVAASHENGGNTGSTGWGYKWNPEIAMRLMPSAHGTAHSARQLVKGVEVPGKYFAIARCYRPDIMDSSHLIEFNQVEGFIVGKELNFRHLLGMLKEFAVEIAGAEEVRFYPDYYPFTEPSVQLSAKHPELGWIEFAGAGIFRPEMMLPLGIKETAIAWGIGADRLAMFNLGIKDIRYLFSDDLDWLRKSRVVG